MGAVGSFLGGVKDAATGGADYLFGNGDKKEKKTIDVADMSTEESAQRKKFLAELQSLLGGQNGPISQSSQAPGMGQQDADLQQLFKTQLIQYLGGPQGQVTPEIQKQATDFVDQTFTNPAQASFNQFQRGYEGQQAEQAAQMGRNPLDSSIQQQNFRTLSDVASNLAAQRGSQIAQRSDLLAYQRPMEQAQVNAGLGLQGINQGYENSNFINSLNQQAFNNRINLANLQSGYFTNLANNRINTAGQTGTNFAPNSGLVGQFQKVYGGFGYGGAGNTSAPGAAGLGSLASSGSAGIPSGIGGASVGGTGAGGGVASGFGSMASMIPPP